MKQLFIPFLMLLFCTATRAQMLQNPYPKTITVNGTAELEIVPDEIYVQVDLREYEKRGQGKVGLEKIKSEFLANARRIGLPDTAISIAAYDGFNGNPWWRKKNKKDELYASISYQVKLKTSRQLDDLVNVLDDEATQNFFIQRTTHSRLAEYRKQLKMAAVKAAKEKAQYLTAAIGEEAGVAVTINEPVEYYVPYYNARVANAMMKEQAADMAPPQENPVDFRKIKLKYDVTVVFALK